jgi:hypothetical protein
MAGEGDWRPIQTSAGRGGGLLSRRGAQNAVSGRSSVSPGRHGPRVDAPSVSVPRDFDTRDGVTEPVEHLDDQRIVQRRTDGGGLIVTADRLHLNRATGTHRRTEVDFEPINADDTGHHSLRTADRSQSPPSLGGSSGRRLYQIGLDCCSRGLGHHREGDLLAGDRVTSAVSDLDDQWLPQGLSGGAVLTITIN